MTEPDLTDLKQLIAQCTPEQRQSLFKELRSEIQIHELEGTFGAPAEVILEAIHRAPELTRRMLRGVIADSAFATLIVPALAAYGWQDDTPPGNHSFDHMLKDAQGRVSVQVKLQRSERGNPVITTGTRFGLGAAMYMVEPQKTRTGKVMDAEGGEKKTRPYRYGEFDVLAVSLQPSNGRWDSFRYTVGNWLLPGVGPNEIATYQPVPMEPNDDWTDDFNVAAQWFRSGIVKRISNRA
ncbi:MAG: hypothetical protein K0M39_02480 [Rhizobium sp.]|nr:hypothetical protein [Rhizobium sp.]